MKRHREYLTSDRRKLELLKVLHDEKWHSYHEVHTRLGMYYYTTKKQLNFLADLELVEIIKVEKEETASKRAHFLVRITKQGKGWLERNKSKIV